MEHLKNKTRGFTGKTEDLNRQPPNKNRKHPTNDGNTGGDIRCDIWSLALLDLNVHHWLYLLMGWTWPILWGHCGDMFGEICHIDET